MKHNLFDEAALEGARHFAGIARMMADQPDADTAAGQIAVLASSVTGCSEAAVARVTDRGTLAFPEPASDAIASMLDIVETTGEGIGMDALRDGSNQVTNDLVTESRWPAYRERVLAETSLKAASAFPLRLGESTLGVLVLYSDRVGFFTDRVLAVGTVLARHASVALAGIVTAEKARHLEVALASNRDIGIAIGVLMARHGITDDEAFGRMRSVSQRSHRKLREIAEYVAMAGDLPGAETVSATTSA